MEAYFSTPSFSWQKIGPPLHYANPQFEQFYNVAMREYWLQSGVNSWLKAVSKSAYIVLISVFFISGRSLWSACSR